MSDDRYRELAIRLVRWMDEPPRQYTLQDTPDEDTAHTKPIPQGLLRDFRKAVYARMDHLTEKEMAAYRVGYHLGLTDVSKAASAGLYQEKVELLYHFQSGWADGRANRDAKPKSAE